jgi:hypothetical protein
LESLLEIRKVEIAFVLGYSTQVSGHTQERKLFGYVILAQAISQQGALASGYWILHVWLPLLLWSLGLCSKVITTEGLDHKFIEQCVEHFCDLLDITVPNIFIFIDDTMKVLGACYENEPGDYMITLRDQADGHMILALAHEMVHVKQFMCNSLSNTFDPMIPYNERWWEIEACEKEVVLMTSLINKVLDGTITKD